jgi:DNA segregation ATPase FtsK/SpoIIIE-like protein
MARKEPKEAAQHTRGFNDIIGFVLIALAALLLLAQLSFDRHDVSSNQFPPNQTTQNWIGQAGAIGANGLFFLFGAGAYLIPIFLTLFGVSHLWDFFAYLRRRWVWGVVLFLSCVGFFHLYTDMHVVDHWSTAGARAGFLERVAHNLNALSAGGLIGRTLNELLFGHFGKPGATIMYCTLYLVSLIYLTNFGLMTWVRQSLGWKRKDEDDEPTQDQTGWSEEEKALSRRLRDLERQARKLQEQGGSEGILVPVGGSGLGADLQPVPAPTVRDLSIPQARTGKGAKGKPAQDGEEPAKPGLEGEIIPAQEVAAATTEEILGKAPAKGAEQAEKTATNGDKKEEATPAAENPNIFDNSRSRRIHRKPKPITVASAPTIGNYSCPRWISCNCPT